MVHVRGPGGGEMGVGWGTQTGPPSFCPALENSIQLKLSAALGVGDISAPEGDQRSN